MAKHHRPKPEMEAETDTQSPSAAEAKLTAFLHGDLRDTLTKAAIVLLIVLAAVFLVKNWRERKAVARQRALAQVEQADTLAELKDLAAEFVGTELGEKASFRLARKLFDDGQHDAAATSFADFCSRYPASRFAADARLGKAYALEAGATLEAAQQAFDEAAQAATDPALAAQAYLGAGRCAQERGELGAAKTFYENAIASATTGVYRDQAAIALKRPQLEPVADTD